ncbi:MAG: flagellin lysine-N-methylase [Roseburia sp.]|nr:flagellin lysine-N-methylase [Roseburia sp.]
MKVIKPEIYDEFQCTGGKCPLTCCGGWVVMMDEKIYKSYRKMGGHIAKFAKKSILYAKEMNIYYVRHDPVTNMCPMCNEEQLCTIVIEKGMDASSQLCKEFPREQFRTIVGEERYLGCSCPVVVGMLYNLEKKISFITETGRKYKTEGLEILPEKDSVELQIREVMLDFIQKAETPLWFREFFGVYTLTKVREDYLKGDYNSVCEKLIHFYSKSFWEPLYLGLKDVEVNREQQFEIMCDFVSASAEQIMKCFFVDKYKNMERIAELLDINCTCTFPEWEQARQKWKADRKDLGEENLFVYDFMECFLPNAKVYPYGYIDEFCLLGNYMSSILITILIHSLKILFYTRYEQDKEMDTIIVAALSRAFRGAGDVSSVKEMIDAARETGVMSIGFLRCLLDI